MDMEKGLLNLKKTVGQMHDNHKEQIDQIKIFINKLCFHFEGHVMMSRDQFLNILEDLGDNLKK